MRHDTVLDQNGDEVYHGHEQFELVEADNAILDGKVGFRGQLLRTFHKTVAVVYGAAFCTKEALNAVDKALLSLYCYDSYKGTHPVVVTQIEEGLKLGLPAVNLSPPQRLSDLLVAEAATQTEQVSLCDNSTSLPTHTQSRAHLPLPSVSRASNWARSMSSLPAPAAPLTAVGPSTIVYVWTETAVAIS